MSLEHTTVDIDSYLFIGFYVQLTVVTGQKTCTIQSKCKLDDGFGGERHLNSGGDNSSNYDNILFT